MSSLPLETGDSLGDDVGSKDRGFVGWGEASFNFSVGDDVGSSVTGFDGEWVSIGVLGFEEDGLCVAFAWDGLNDGLNEDRLLGL